MVVGTKSLSLKIVYNPRPEIVGIFPTFSIYKRFGDRIHTGRQMRKLPAPAFIWYNESDSRKPIGHTARKVQILNFQYTPELLKYMKEKNKRHIAVEVAKADHSDFDVTELYYRFVSDRMLEDLKNRRYRIHETEVGFVALPPYVLHYSETVTFGLKKTLFIHSITCEGIKL